MIFGWRWFDQILSRRFSIRTYHVIVQISAKLERARGWRSAGEFYLEELRGLLLYKCLIRWKILQEIGRDCSWIRTITFKITSDNFLRCNRAYPRKI